MERVATSFLLTIVCTVVSIGDSWRCEQGMDREDRDALIARYLPEGWHLEDELALLAVQSGEKQSVMEQRLQVMDHYINYTLSGAEAVTAAAAALGVRSEEHTSELQSLMRISSAGFCVKKKNNTH